MNCYNQFVLPGLNKIHVSKYDIYAFLWLTRFLFQCLIRQHFHNVLILNITENSAAEFNSEMRS